MHPYMLVMPVLRLIVSLLILNQQKGWTRDELSTKHGRAVIAMTVLLLNTTHMPKYVGCGVASCPPSSFAEALVRNIGL